MSESSTPNDDFALFAEFLKWKREVQTKAKSSSAVDEAATATVVLPGPESEIELTKTPPTAAAPSTTSNLGPEIPSSDPGSPVGGITPTSDTEAVGLGSCAKKNFTANDYLSRDKKFTEAKKAFRVSVL